MRSGLDRHRQVIPPGQFLPCRRRRAYPQAFPAASLWSGLGCPMPPALTRVHPAGPGRSEGADPTPCLTLSGLAGVQLPSQGQGLCTSPPPPCPGLSRACMSSWGPEAGQPRRMVAQEGRRQPATWLGCPVGLPVGPLPAGTELDTGYF